MNVKEFFTEDTAKAAATLGIDFTGEEFTLDDLRRGMNVELEHGSRDADTDVTGDDPVATAKIALAHLREFPDYYRRLERMEAEADAARALEVEEDLGIL